MRGNRDGEPDTGQWDPKLLHTGISREGAAAKRGTFDAIHGGVEKTRADVETPENIND